MKSVLTLLFLFSLNSHAFTLVGSSGLEGWATDQLVFKINPSVCSISEEVLNGAIDSAVQLWNSIPTSRIVLSRGARVTSTAAQVFKGNAASGPDSPVIVCDPDLGKTIGDNPDYIPAATLPSASHGLQLDYAFMLLNSQDGKAANLANIPPTKLAIIIAHEMGHVLGLGHTQDENSIMYFDATKKAQLSLSQDDMDGITYLYPRAEWGNAKALGCATITRSGSGSGMGRGYRGASHKESHGENNAKFELGMVLMFCLMVYACFRKGTL